MQPLIHTLMVEAVVQSANQLIRSDEGFIGQVTFRISRRQLLSQTAPVLLTAYTAGNFQQEEVREEERVQLVHVYKEKWLKG